MMCAHKGRQSIKRCMGVIYMGNSQIIAPYPEIIPNAQFESLEKPHEGGLTSPISAHPLLNQSFLARASSPTWQRVATVNGRPAKHFLSVNHDHRFSSERKYPISAQTP